eukprot:TRINITY_DN7902_c0_g1_i24.p1 TRINITY_DN7902_c0_g1~~TRINITY_DN7902_c0_g1_i24.p1  ORF type:complete len:276 (-),score=79.57 TRINITY_DN7902_c0_g1_i24:185-1012(-)
MGLFDVFIDPTTLPDNGYGFIQLLFLALVYGAVLSYSAQVLTEGSELLLLIPATSGIVGSVVLPVLGAVPDGAIVLFSGMGSDAQAQLNVGIGTLAGSTVMLLTVPWFMALFAGRVSLDPNGKPLIKSGAKGLKLVPEGSMNLCSTGVKMGKSIKRNGYLMGMTALGYLCIQGSAFDDCFKEHDEGCKADNEKWFAVLSLVYALAGFIGYLALMVYHQYHEMHGSTLREKTLAKICLLYTSDAADEEDSVDLGGRRIIKKKKNKVMSGRGREEEK